jgi:hypothetical protein
MANHHGYTIPPLAIRANGAIINVYRGVRVSFCMQHVWIRSP